MPVWGMLWCDSWVGEDLKDRFWDFSHRSLNLYEACNVFGGDRVERDLVEFLYCCLGSK